MLTIILFYVAVSIISAGVSVYFMKSAPSGWEDKAGFHIGTKKAIRVLSKDWQEEHRLQIENRKRVVVHSHN